MTQNLYSKTGKTGDLAKKCMDELGKIIDFDVKESYYHRNYYYAIETYRGPQLPVSVFDRNLSEESPPAFGRGINFVWNYGRNNKYGCEASCIETKVPEIHEYMKRRKIKGMITIVFKSDRFGMDFKLLYVTISQEDYFILHRSLSSEVNENVEIPFIDKFTSLLELFDRRLKEEGYPDIHCNSCVTKKIHYYKDMRDKFLDVRESFGKE